MKYLIMIGFLTVLNLANAQKTETVVILTSAECDMCKERIEEAMNYMKGVSYAELDLESKKLTVKYRKDKVTLAEIKNKIAETGYDADEVKADKEGLEKLPDCCKPGGGAMH